MDEIRTCLCVYDDINVICITETHLKKSVLDAEIEIEGYKFCRKDRNFNIKNNDISSCIGLLDVSFIFDQIWSILISL